MKGLIIAALIFLAPIVVQAETIDSFVSDIMLSSDGSFFVTETIIYDFGEENRHGIFRTITLGHPQDSQEYFKERIIEIDVRRVTMDGESIPSTESDEGRELKIKIGDPDRTISGVHTYRIEYLVQGALFYHDNETELYWNVTGNGWEVPILLAEAHVHDPEGISTEQQHCYFGAVGSTNECEVSTTATSTIFSVENLEPGEGLTVAQALDASLVDRQVIEHFSLWPLWLVGALMWFVGLIWFSYRHMVEHKTNNSIVAQYEPYEGFKPMYTGVLFDGRVDPQDITAGIVYLAEQGFFKIKYAGKKTLIFFNTDDYEISLLRPYADLETDFQKTLFTLMFDKDAAVGSAVMLSELAKDTSKQQENYKLVTELRAAAEAELLKHGFFEYRWRKLFMVAGGLLLALLTLLGLNFIIGADMTPLIVISVFTFIFSAITLAIVYRRRTRKGYEALDYLKGFKEFLSVTDKERFKFHNAPKKSPEQFMAYLPYAIAFGVEKEWAEAFKDISIPEPSWYDGQGSAFSAVYLSQSLGTFGTSVASASSTASSGGGSSGGGAGGGGGGSW